MGDAHGLGDVEAACAVARPPAPARAATQPLATPCAAKNPAVSTAIPTTTTHSGPASVTSSPAPMTATATGTTARRPTRSASRPPRAELTDPSA